MRLRNSFQEKHIQDFSKKFDKSLLSHISKQTSVDKRIKQSMCYFVKTGGKRVRPFLIITMGKLIGIKAQTLNDFSLAVECVHLHSLIHDDLPAMDNDDYRRGKLTVHKKFDEATAVLAGDMFQVLSVKTLVESKHLLPREKVEAIQMLSKANGLEGLIAGQSLDIYMKKKSSIKAEGGMNVYQQLCSKDPSHPRCQMLESKEYSTVDKFGNKFTENGVSVYGDEWTHYTC